MDRIIKLIDAAEAEVQIGVEIARLGSGRGSRLKLRPHLTIRGE